MIVYKHTAYKETTIEWVEKVVIEGVRKVEVEGEEKETLVKEVVEIPRSKADHSIQFEWFSENPNPVETTLYPNRRDVLYKTDAATPEQTELYREQKERAVRREERAKLKSELTVFRNKTVLTLPEMKQAFDKLFDLMEK